MKGYSKPCKISNIFKLFLNWNLFFVVTVTLALTFFSFKSVFAIPAAPGIKTIEMPDGSTVQVRLIGDERINWYETVDGYTLVKDQKGFFEYAIRDASGKLASTGFRAGTSPPPLAKHIKPTPEVIATAYARMNDLSPTVQEASLTGISGTEKILTLLIEFTDVKHALDHEIPYFDFLFFTDTFGSLNNYLKAISYNQLDIIGSANGWYQSIRTMAYYGYDNDPNMTHMWELVIEAVDAADVAGVNFADYDQDGDGFVDHLVIVHAGGDAAAGVPNAIWSHSWAVNPPYQTSDGTYVSAYVMNSEDNYMGVFAHEFMHNIGAPDLYDYDYDGIPVSDWCVMDYGAYGGSPAGTVPTHLCGYLKNDIDANPYNGALGWLSLTTISQNGDYTISQLATPETNSLFRVDIPNDNEYFLIENRQPVNYDVSLPDSGILIYHVDEDMPDGPGRLNDGTPNSSFYRIIVEDPGNTMYKSGAAYSQEDSQQTFDDTTLPNSRSNQGIDSGISIYNIGSSQQYMTFSLLNANQAPVDADGDGFLSDVDCNDNDPAINPGATEICEDGIDQDCDGVDLSCNPVDNDGDGFLSDVDCNDNDPTINPGAIDICNDGIDQNCDGADNNCTFSDRDGDGYDYNDDCNNNDPTINPGATEICGDGIDQDCDGVDLSCNPVDNDGDGFFNDVDCNDNDPAINPGATEICGDGIDQDCDGVDQVCPPVDNDGDGFLSDVDCNDNDPTVNPGATEICGDGIDNDCDGIADNVDLDGDGYISLNCGGNDCNDNDPAINPGATEVCEDGIDQNCDGTDQICNLDADGDGFLSDVDCNDNDPTINPGAIDICNDGIDQNCDGADNNCAFSDRDGDGYDYNDDCNDNDPSINPGATDICGDGIDQDCDGVDLSCNPVDNDGDGFFNDVDCNDNDPAINPGATEICGDGIDNDCDGIADNVDLDGDGYISLNCGGNDCNDNDPSINPGATEVCEDGIDQNCDGTDQICNLDADGDGFLSDVDCNDNDPTINPGAIDICNDGIDQNCDGADNNCAFSDRDGDGYDYNDDCNDNDPTINPGATEICGDGIDQDCDGVDLSCNQGVKGRGGFTSPARR